MLAGVVLFRSTRSIPVRIFAVASPLLMAVAVVLTGNHWVIDGFVGIALAMIGLYVAHRLGLAHPALAGAKRGRGRSGPGGDRTRDRAIMSRLL